MWFRDFIFTEEIFTQTWRDPNDYKVIGIPDTFPYEGNTAPTFQDIKTWHVLYYDSGNIGVYKAHTPEANMWMIVHEQFLEIPESVEQYYDKESLTIRLEELNIVLP